MDAANSTPEAALTVPTWRRVSELADIVEVFDPQVQVCTWRREIDPAIERYLSELHPAGETQVLNVLSADAPPRLEFLPARPGRATLIEDLVFLREIICELLGCVAVGLRFVRIGRAMCPGWHVDRTGIRLVCTYQGPGTQWLNDQGVDRNDLHSDGAGDGTFIQAAQGDIVLLKGALWQDNEAFGAIHRSPELGPATSLRTLITLDPLWRD